MEIRGLTIVIPTYNRLQCLEEAINSLRKQNYQNWELIVVDDHSPVDSRPLVEEFMKKDERIKYFRNERRKGPSGSRNVGIAHATYDHILFIDDDIVLQSKTIGLLVDDFNELSGRGINIGGITPAIVNVNWADLGSIKSGKQIKEKDKKPYLGVYEIKRSKYTGMIFDNFSPDHKKLQEVPHVHACSLYSKKALMSAGRYDENLYQGNYFYEDADLAFRVWKEGFALYFEPRAIIYHVRIADGGCRVKNKYKHIYYYVINWIKYLMKNYRWKAAYMIPFFGVFLITRGMQKVAESTISSKKTRA